MAQLEKRVRSVINTEPLSECRKVFQNDRSMMDACKSAQGDLRWGIPSCSIGQYQYQCHLWLPWSKHVYTKLQGNYNNVVEKDRWSYQRDKFLAHSSYWFCHIITMYLGFFTARALFRSLLCLLKRTSKEYGKKGKYRTEASKGISQGGLESMGAQTTSFTDKGCVIQNMK